MSPSSESNNTPEGVAVTSDEVFFSKKNLVLGGWALLITLIASLSGYLWSVLEGPPQVYVESTAQDPALRYAILQTEALQEMRMLQSSLAEVVGSSLANNDIQQQYLQVLASEVATLIGFLKDESSDIGAETRSSLEQTLRVIEKTRYQQIEQELEQNMLRKELSERNAELEEAIESLTNALNTAQIGARGARGASSGTVKFQLPNSAKGYTPVRLSGIRRANCPENDISKGDSLYIKFYVSKRELLENASPIILRLSKVQNDGNSLYQVFERA